MIYIYDHICISVSVRRYTDRILLRAPVPLWKGRKPKPAPKPPDSPLHYVLRCGAEPTLGLQTNVKTCIHMYISVKVYAYLSTCLYVYIGSGIDADINVL